MPRHIHDPSMALPGPPSSSSEGGTTGQLLEVHRASSPRRNDRPGYTNRPLARVLERFDDVRAVRPGQHVTLCPVHGDRKPSLHIAEGSDGRVLMNCKAGCSTEMVLKTIGLAWKDLFPQNGTGGGGLTARIEKVYPYRDEQGEVLFEVVRLKDPKNFLQRRPDGKGGYIWKVKGVRRVLYRLLDLRETDPDRMVFVPEGEKDADRLWAENVPGTTNPGGAGKWAGVDDTVLHDRHVVILPHNDAAGIDHAQDVARRLAGKAASVKILLLPGLPADGGDVSNWLDAGGTADELWRLAESAPDAMPDQTTSPSRGHPLSQGKQGNQGGSGTLVRNVLPCDKEGVPPGDTSRDEGDHEQKSASTSRWDGEANAFDDVIRDCLPPTKTAYRRALFNLARRLRFDPRTESLPVASMRPIVARWCDQAADAVRGKTKTQVWFDFTYGWEHARYRLGYKPADQAFKDLDHAPIPPCVNDYSDDHEVQTLVRWCAQMQRMAGIDSDWPMGVDLMAHHLFGVPLDWRRPTEAPQQQQKQWARLVKKASRMMLGLMRDGVVERTLKVIFEPNPSRGKKACRYQFVKPLD